jgi:NDP-mannose synthase
MQAIILAGGKGSRLKPFTTNFPKPLVPIDDIPILEIILKQLKYYGVKDVVLAVNHMADLIMAFFKNGEKLGLNISYSVESEPLGTAGPISIVKNLDENFLVLNGDVLTTLNFKSFFNFHKKKKTISTIATFNKEVKIDLGVLETNGDVFDDYIEKPTYNFTVSMGIYVFNKSIVQYLEKGTPLDIPDLILKLKENKEEICCYKGDYDWLDIGRVDDYEMATKIFKEQKSKYLKGE